MQDIFQAAHVIAREAEILPDHIANEEVEDNMLEEDVEDDSGY